MRRQTPTIWRTGWLEFYLDDWVKFFGYSKKVRLDSEGARMSPETKEVLKRLGIVVGSISEEAHWQLGIAEVSSKLVRTTRGKGEQEGRSSE